MRWSGVRISGGSPKQNSLQTEAVFVCAAGARFERSSGGTTACVTHLKGNNFVAKSASSYETASFYRIYTLRVLHTLVNFTTLIVYYRQSTPRAANARDFLYHSKNTANGSKSQQRFGNDTQKVFWLHSPHPHKFRK